MKQHRINRSLLLGVILSATMSSCLTTSNYKAPEVNTEGLYRNSSSTDTTTIASLSWRQYFSDPNLQQLIEEGLANSFDMQIALERMEEARIAFQGSKQALLPSIGVAGQVTHITSSTKDANGDVNILSKSSNRYQFGLAAIWEVDLWGKLRRQSRAKFAQYLNSQEARNLVQSNIIAGVATYYYSLLALDEQLAITKETIGLLKETVNTMEALKASGQLNAASIEQTKSTLYGAEVSVPSLEIKIHEMENSLSLLLGRNAGKIARGTFAEQVVPNELKIGLPFQMLANRPDVRKAELSFRSAFELTKAARANFYPTLSLTQGSMLGFASTNLSDLFKPQSILANVIANLIQPIFAQGQLTSGYNIAKAEQKIALLNFHKTVIEAGSEVSNILYTYNTSLKKDEFRNKQIDALKNSVEYTNLLLKAGESSYLEVITAESNLLNAKLGKVNDKLEQLRASVNLYKALGGGTR